MAEASSWKKPRRAEEGVLQYISTLVVLTGEQKTARETEADEAAIDDATIVDNVLEELKTKTASVICEKKACVCMQELVCKANASQLCTILQRLLPYVQFLSTNRYSSHVIQALFARIPQMFGSFGSGMDETLQQAFTDAIREFADGMLPDLLQIAQDTSGTHVLRSLVCVMAGLPVVAEKKGRNSKHNHSVEHTVPLEGLLDAQQLLIREDKFLYEMAETMNDKIVAIADALLGSPLRQMQLLAMNMNGCAFMALLLRVLHSCPIHGMAEKADELEHRLLQWERPHGGEGVMFFYGMAGEASGSMLLETLLLVCSMELFSSFLTYALKGSMVEYSTHARANFVVQATLRRLAASATKEHSLRDAAEEILNELTAGSTIEQLLTAGKGGVVLWMLEVKYAWQLQGDGIIDHILNWGREDENDEAKNEIGEDESDDDNKEEEAANQRLCDKVVSRLLGIKELAPSQQREGKFYLDPGNTRLVAVILRNKHNVDPEARRLFATSITHLSDQELLALSTASLGAKQIIDPILDASAADGDAKKQLADRLMPSILALATDRIGHIVVQRLFEQCELPVKEAVANQLQQHRQRLAGSKFGTNSLRAAQADLYGRDASEWRRRMKKSDKGQALLQELETEETSRRQQSKPATKSRKRKTPKSHKGEPRAVTADREDGGSHEQQQQSTKRNKPNHHKPKRHKAEAADMELVNKLKNSRGISYKSLQGELERIQSERS